MIPTAVPATFSLVNTMAEALVTLGLQHYDQRCDEEALCLLEAASAMSTSATCDAYARASKLLRMGHAALHVQAELDSIEENHLDLYLEDECDNGPRVLRKPVRQTHADPAISDVCIAFNRGLVCHSMSRYMEAKRHYESVIACVRARLATPMNPLTNVVLELGMRAENNLGFINYCEGEEHAALTNFEASLLYAKNLCGTIRGYELECVDVLSNMCRVAWMFGDLSEQLHLNLQEVLRIRTSFLSKDHPDIAAAHYNLAVAEYSRQRCASATANIQEYLKICHLRTASGKDDMDAVPGLIYLMLIKNENKNDRVANELVRGLRTLQEKRQDLGPKTPEVASVLNYIGTLLFHQEDFENSLLFFQEELRLELALSGDANDMSTSVTCNNIGRILQEMGKYREAIDFYQRALMSVYGDICHLRLSGKSASEICAKAESESCSQPNTSSSNLYSTVWYNLGLIHDKLGSYDDAIFAFEMSLQLRRAMLGVDHPDIACLLYNIGVLRMERQQLDEASVCFREALRVRRIGAAGQLNDSHVVKTLEKLSSFQKAKGNIQSSLEVSQEILAIQEVSPDYEGKKRLRHTGVTLRSIAELHHAVGDLQAAMEMVQESAVRLRRTVVKEETEPLDRYAYLSDVEQLACSLLLWGSLEHELCEPVKARSVLDEATLILSQTNSSFPSHSLSALQEVTGMLATCHCAPEA